MSEWIVICVLEFEVDLTLSKVWLSCHTELQEDESFLYYNFFHNKFLPIINCSLTWMCVRCVFLYYMFTGVCAWYCNVILHPQFVDILIGILRISNIKNKQLFQMTYYSTPMLTIVVCTYHRMLDKGH